MIKLNKLNLSPQSNTQVPFKTERLTWLQNMLWMMQNLSTFLMFVTRKESMVELNKSNLSPQPKKQVPFQKVPF